MHLASLSAVAPLCRGTHPRRQRAVRSIHGLAPRSLGRSVDQRISASAAAAMVQQRPKLPLEFLFISSMPSNKICHFFDVFKVVSKVLYDDHSAP